MPSNHAVVPHQTALARAQTIVPYLTPQDVRQLAEAASHTRKGERDGLLIHLLFETGVRISEALQMTLQHTERFEGRPVLRTLGKGKKPRLVAWPKPLADNLQAYAYRHQLTPTDRVFPINRQRAHQIIAAAGKRAGLNKEVYPHFL